MKEDNRPDHVVEDDDPSKGVTRSPSTHRKCIHTKKGVCSIHGPGAKYRWRPGTKRVTGEDGVIENVNHLESWHLLNMVPGKLPLKFGQNWASNS